VLDYQKCEKEIIQRYRKMCGKPMKGREWFKGDINTLRLIYKECVRKYGGKKLKI
jgi:hypothetical protein